MDAKELHGDLQRTWLGTGRTWISALIAGCGFAMSFGWVWFPALSERVFCTLPEVFSGTLLSGGGICVFAATLLVGFAAAGFLAHRLRERNDRLTAVLLHGAALACMAGGMLGSGVAPRASAFLFGLSAAGPGVFWTARLLALPPLWTGVGLTTATLLAWPVSFAFSAHSAYPPVALAIAVCLLLRCEKSQAGKRAFSPIHADAVLTVDEKTAAPLRDDVLSLVLLSSSFFAFGVTAPAAPVPTGANLPAAAVGVALATACCARIGAAARGAFLLAAAMALPATALLVFLPGLAVVEAVLGGAAEGAALVGLAAWPSKSGNPNGPGIRPLRYLPAAFCLATVFAVVNFGGAVGAAITRTSDAGLRLVATVCIALCLPALLLVAERHGQRRRDSAPALSTRPRPEREDTDGQVEKTFSPAATLWSALTRRECDVSELLIQGKSNPEICASLFISENTVRTHIKNIYHKTGVADREQLKGLLKYHSRQCQNRRPSSERP